MALGSHSHLSVIAAPLAPSELRYSQEDSWADMGLRHSGVIYAGDNDFLESDIDRYQYADREAFVSDRPTAMRRFMGALTLRNVFPRLRDRSQLMAEIRDAKVAEYESLGSKWKFEVDTGPLPDLEEETLATVTSIDRKKLGLGRKAVACAMIGASAAAAVGGGNILASVLDRFSSSGNLAVAGASPAENAGLIMPEITIPDTSRIDIANLIPPTTIAVQKPESLAEIAIRIIGDNEKRLRDEQEAIEKAAAAKSAKAAAQAVENAKFIQVAKSESTADTGENSCRAAIRAEWPSELQDGAITVLIHENRAEDPEAIGGPNNDGTYDKGCMQVNTGAHRNFFANHNWANARENVRYAYQIFLGAGWRAWYAVQGILW